MAIYCVNFGENFIFQKFCLCKKKDKYEVWQGRVTAAQSWPLFQERKKYFRRCNENLTDRNFYSRTKPSWKDVQNIYKQGQKLVSSDALAVEVIVDIIDIVGIIDTVDIFSNL